MSVARSERRPRGELSRVLVIDDEPDIRELIDLTLSRMGLAAACAGSVAEARQAQMGIRDRLCAATSTGASSVAIVSAMRRTHSPLVGAFQLPRSMRSQSGNFCSHRLCQ